jgi:cell division topological specificity factor
MGFLNYFRKESGTDSAAKARERLHVVVAHQRAARNQPDFLPEMQQEIIRVIQKYVSIEKDEVSVQLDKHGNCSVLELNVTLPQ